LCATRHTTGRVTTAGTLPAVTKTRLDSLLVERGLFDNRSRAAAAVLAGAVRLGADGRAAQKPGQMVRGDVELAVDQPPPFVSRGGTKLANALDRLGVDPSGRRCLDVGASTGGFTDCLLKRGAAHVVALDVAYGELDWGLRNDPRVTVIERANARAIEPKILPYAPEMVVVDVSFISLRKVLPAVLEAAAPSFDCLALVKPQFELGRGGVGKGGVVRSADARREALVTVAEDLAGGGWSVLGFASSELPGPAGNRESFLWLAEPGRDGARTDVTAAAREVEP
jgi:23S rRNA (cytidine1920-2'-O)/16S rRNA (cytidine1409-2'-O)-methyltransferase